MATPFSDVYRKFLNDITDRNLVINLTDEDMSEILSIYLSESDLYFKNCKKNLSNRSDSQFNETLTSEEILIIAKCMILSWFSHILLDENKLKAKLTTKDYNQSSEGNVLDKLIKIDENIRKEVKQLIVSYSYNDFKGFS